MLQIIRTQASILPFRIRRYLPDDAVPELVPEEQFEQTAAIFGPAGRDGAAAQTFEHTQSVSASQWTVNHNFGRSPTSVRVLTAGGVEVEAQVTETSLNQLVVSFAVPFTGRVVVT